MGSRATPVLATPPPPLHTHGQTQAGSLFFSSPEQRTPGPLDPGWKDGKSTRRFSIFCGADDPSSGNHLEILAAAAYDVARERRRRRRDEPEDDDEDDEEGGKSRKGSTCIPLPPTHPPERAARPPAGAEGGGGDMSGRERLVASWRPRSARSKFLWHPSSPRPRFR